jgi:hypothetical protein
LPARRKIISAKNKILILNFNTVVQCYPMEITENHNNIKER